MGFVLHSTQWITQGIVIAAAGLLPLFITSQSLLASLTTFGTGRLIGSSLFSFFSGVSLGAASTLSVPGLGTLSFSPAAFTISHIAGILFMLVVERKLSSRTLDASPPARLDSNSLIPSIIVTQDDIELRERQRELPEEVLRDQPPPASQPIRAFGPHQRRIYLFTFAFIFQQITAGISLGYGATEPPWKPADTAGGDRLELSLPGPVTIYVLGLAGEVAATLGFATTLLSASLPVAECKRHVLLYAAARPLVAFLSYGVTTLSQTARIHNNRHSLMIVITSFASGLFVYAALVVRALITVSRTTARRGLFARMSLMAAGALLPYILPMVVTIGHIFWYDGKLGRDTPTAEVAQTTVV